MIKTPVSKCEIPVRWRDLDDFGHVNNSVFFTYFEQARATWWLDIGLSLKHQDQGPVVITADCTFLKPLFFPTDIEVDVFVLPPGRSSYMIEYEIYLANENNEKIAQGSTKIVWVDYQKQCSVPLPEMMLKHLPTK